MRSRRAGEEEEEEEQEEEEEEEEEQQQQLTLVVVGRTPALPPPVIGLQRRDVATTPFPIFAAAFQFTIHGHMCRDGCCESNDIPVVA